MIIIEAEGFALACSKCDEGMSQKALLSSLLSKKGLNLDNLEIQRDEYGKPFFANSNLFFNISHSSDYILAGLSDYKIGVDIELKRLRDFVKYAPRFMCTNEYEQFEKKSRSGDYFYDIWCAKESFLKCKGTGIRTSLRDIEIRGDEVLYKGVLQRGFRLQRYDFFLELSACICIEYIR